MSKAILTKKEWPSYQLALRCLKFLGRKPCVKTARALAAEIRAYRNEERKTN